MYKIPDRTALVRAVCRTMMVALAVLMGACSESSTPITGTMVRVAPSFLHVPGSTLADHVVGVEVSGTTAHVIWHKDPELAAGPGKYLAILSAGNACTEASVVASYNGDALPWTMAGHLYTEFANLAAGDYCVQVKSAGLNATNPYKKFVSATFSISPVGSNSPPVIAFGYTGDPLNEGDASTFTITASDDDLDELTVQYTLSAPNGTVVASSSAGLTAPYATPVTFSYTFPDNGTYTLSMRATDGTDEVIADEEIEVANVAPSLGAISVSQSSVVAVGTAVPASVDFTDPGADSWSCTISWGDGTQSSVDCASRSAAAAHNYAAAGIYTLTIAVSDDDAGTDSEEYHYVVVYDPSAGFVTGGGWINSTPGMYRVNPTLAGKATFGFVSKYLRGATTPTGNTEFQFHAAGMTFRSTSYQWLVVSGTKATYKGQGTLNGVAGYGFLLSAIDGSPDRFRVKIVNLASDAIVYDNLLDGAGDDADPSTAIGSGSIIIHTKR